MADVLALVAGSRAASSLFHYGRLPPLHHRRHRLFPVLESQPLNQSLEI